MGLLSSLFGGGTKQTSTNAAYDDLKGALGGVLPYAGQAGSGISAFLGGDSSGFDAYKKGAGFDYGSLMASRGITGNRAAQGLLRSSGTADRLAADYDARTDAYAQNYLSQLLGLGGLGLNAGQVLASTAPQTTEQKKSGGLGGILGLGLSLFSDPRLKADIEKIGEEADGLGRYRFRYVWDRPETRREGVMADEVAELRPWALGPRIAGYQTVRHDLLGAA